MQLHLYLGMWKKINIWYQQLLTMHAIAMSNFAKFFNMYMLLELHKDLT